MLREDHRLKVKARKSGVSQSTRIQVAPSDSLLLFESPRTTSVKLNEISVNNITFHFKNIQTNNFQSLEQGLNCLDIAQLYISQALEKEEGKLLQLILKKRE